MLFFFIVTSCEKNDIEKNNEYSEISLTELPQEIIAFLNTHFQGLTIQRAYLENEYGRQEYQIYLQNGIELEFDTQFLLIGADGYSKLPDSLIPESILLYVNSNYPNNVIYEWEIEYSYQEIELNNGIELIFNLAGEFIKVKVS